MALGGEADCPSKAAKRERGVSLPGNTLLRVQAASAPGAWSRRLVGRQLPLLGIY